jgi:hypothetical protein
MNKKLSLEDKIKPYLVLAKAFEFQAYVIKNKNNEKDLQEVERIERLENLKNLILNQMMFQFTTDDLITEGNLSSFLDNPPELVEFNKRLETKEKLPLNDLINTLKIDTFKSIKQKLKEAEK